MTVDESRLPDAAATEAFGARLAACFPGSGLLVFLRGELGAGKTTLVRGLLRALGHRNAVKSPTYTLVESYQLPALQVHHLDLYRLADAEELEWLGIRDLLASDAVCLIEWPERGTGVLPPADLELTLTYQEAGRRVAVRPHSDAGRQVASCLAHNPALGSSQAPPAGKI
jgi:tRNA threonylcarbamoyladenosine biosynthesis protein TsaE